MLVEGPYTGLEKSKQGHGQQHIDIREMHLLLPMQNKTQSLHPTLGAGVTLQAGEDEKIGDIRYTARQRLPLGSSTTASDGRHPSLLYEPSVLIVVLQDSV